MYSAGPMNTPITELSNETTVDIDQCDSTEIVRLLRQCDADIFSGWRNYPSLYDADTLHSLENLGKRVQAVLEDPLDSCVVFSGCGTSGRIGFSLSKRFNSLAKEQGMDEHRSSGPYEYLIAGGDLALFTSVEAPEDSWRQGQIDLMNLAKEKKQVVYIGITCGLSAPYIAGQLDFCMDRPDTFTPVLIGFNPIDLARKSPIQDWSKTFFDVANRLRSHKTAIILNPIVGPEAITGSSRMKGGSTTKILLETALLNAHYRSYYPGHSPSTTTILSHYKEVHRHTYLQIKEMSSALSLAGKSLSLNGHIYYLGWGPTSFIALVDASECVPTFSASFDDVRAFVDGGFEYLKNRDGVLEFKGSKLKISLHEFANTVLPSVSENDTVIAICSSPKYLKQADELLRQVSLKGAKLIGITSKTDGPSDGADFEECFDVSIRIHDGKCKANANGCFVESSQVLEDVFKECLEELSLKWLLNAISTGAHVLHGKVLKGYMIDLKVSNDKLFYRAAGIVSNITGVTKQEAMNALLKAIYRKDVIPEEIRKVATSSHVFEGERQDKVVPLAVLLATGKFNVESGLKTLQEKKVSQVLKQLGLLFEDFQR
ncbi:glucokinase regulatory protein-like [Actinia tenebrosa]|uniref:Glucokinase regulatory protein-like n=1 Tax=Actinia tenebrosa TaxID=6105 RepID=A0A6P8IM45_ACTTE|nr:glucokinase regulatory protein-like [Actinia tenebrosa]